MATPQSTPTDAVEYRGIDGFPGYRVGNDGSVWSCWRTQGCGKGLGGKAVLTDQWKRMTPTAETKKKTRTGGHLYLTLCANGKRCRRFVHALVLLAFVGPRPDGMQACHFPDRDPANNAATNLRWDTRKANYADSVIHGTAQCGERHHLAQLTAELVRAIRAEYATGETSCRLLGLKYDQTAANILKVVSRKTWKHA